MNSVGNISKKIKEGFIGQRMIVLPPNIKKIVLRNALINRFYLTDMGFYPHAVNHDRERKAGCHQYILLYCIEGKGTIYLPGNTIELVPNTLLYPGMCRIITKAHRKIPGAFTGYILWGRRQTI